MPESVAAEYVRRRGRLLWDITSRISDADAEDVLHDVWVDRLTNARATNMRILVLHHCGRWWAMRSRMLVGLVRESLPAADFGKELERRQLIELAGGVLTRSEVELLLREWDKAPPAAFARRIRIARRKARRVIG